MFLHDNGEISNDLGETLKIHVKTDKRLAHKKHACGELDISILDYPKIAYKLFKLVKKMSRRVGMLTKYTRSSVRIFSNILLIYNKLYSTIQKKRNSLSIFSTNHKILNKSSNI